MSQKIKGLTDKVTDLLWVISLIATAFFFMFE
jgi:hypothetical protein